MKKYLDKIGKNSKKASIKSVTPTKKNKVLIDFANLIKKNRTKIIYQNNFLKEIYNLETTFFNEL